VLDLYLRSSRKENLRRIFAVLFLFFLLAEWGSHGAMNASHSSVETQSISADQGHDDDPCHSFVLCSDGKRKDQQTQGFSHDVSHNAVFDRLSGWSAPIGVWRVTLIPFATAHTILRPTSPPFHPPELS
jgi:hypothetical protein